jgi:hypothetical protein
MMLRTGRFDSFIFGDSTAFLLDPAVLSSGLGGHFANLSMADGQAWEQLEMLRFALSRVPQPQTLVLTIDHRVWCLQTPRWGVNAFPRFPLWLYQQRSWTNLSHMFNDGALVDALHVIAQYVGRSAPVMRDDGYYDFAGDEHDYALESARYWIYQYGRGRLDPPVDPPEQVDPDVQAAWSFPAVDALKEMLQSVPAATRVVFATVPVHMAAQPRLGTADAQREDACNLRFARLAALRGTVLIDFSIESPVTRTDTNYFDRLHYRKAVAHQLEQSLVQASTTAQPDPDGFWRLIDLR